MKKFLLFIIAVMIAIIAPAFVMAEVSMDPVAGIVTVPGINSIPDSVRFRETKVGDSVRINTVAYSFGLWFGKGQAQKVEPVYTLRRQILQSKSQDGDITNRLGKNFEVSLDAIYALIQAQGKRQSGPLLTNGKQNVFFVRDGKGILRTVYLTWLSGYSIAVPELPPVPTSFVSQEDSLTFVRTFNSIKGEVSYATGVNKSCDSQRGWIINASSIENEPERFPGALVWYRN